MEEKDALDLKVEELSDEQLEGVAGGDYSPYLVDGRSDYKLGDRLEGVTCYVCGMDSSFRCTSPSTRGYRSWDPEKQLYENIYDATFTCETCHARKRVVGTEWTPWGSK